MKSILKFRVYEFLLYFLENLLQQLAPLPKKLLLDLQKYYLKPPALLPTDIVTEFRKVFDDSYNRQYKTRVDPNINKHQMDSRMQMQMQQMRPMLTGKKKVPITKPYVEFLMLYDALKREAKTQKLHQYGVSRNAQNVLKVCGSSI